MTYCTVQYAQTLESSRSGLRFKKVDGVTADFDADAQVAADGDGALRRAGVLRASSAIASVRRQRAIKSYRRHSST